MSTRAMVDFVDSWDLAEVKKNEPDLKIPNDDKFYVEGKRLVRVEARIYRHCDGYPEGLGSDLLHFFDEVERQTKDTRFGDAEYLAAKFVVWQAAEYTKPDRYDFAPEAKKPLDFLGVGVSLNYHGDLEFVYRVDCSRRGDDKRPTVEVAPFSGYGGGPEKAGKFKKLPAVALKAYQKAKAEIDKKLEAR